MESGLLEKIRGIALKYDTLSQIKSTGSFFDLLEQSIQSYQAIIDCMPGNVYWFDAQCNAAGCNKNVLKTLGLNSLQEFKGMSFAEMQVLCGWSESTARKFEEDTRRVLVSGSPIMNEEEPPIRDAEGRWVYFLTNRMPIFDSEGKIVGVVGISVNISELKRVQDELVQEKKVAEIAHKKSESLTALKVQFVRNMEHDLRTPFTGLLGFSDYLWREEQDPARKKQIGYIVQAAEELLDCCNKILDFEQISERHVSLLHREFSVREVCQSIIRIERPALEHKLLDFRFDYDENIPKILLGDAVRLHRVLLNLLGNAIKFTEIGFVSLRVSLLQQKEKKVLLRFVIADSGVGISDAYQEAIFERFTRFSSSNTGSYRGLGLGLGIVKQLMQEMGGEIDLKSAPCRGTEFFCTIPFELPLFMNL